MANISIRRKSWYHPARPVTVAVAAAAALTLVAACGTTTNTQTEQPSGDGSYTVPAEYKRMVLVGASQGGILYNWAVAASQIFNTELGMQTSVQAGATQANALQLETGQIQFGMTSPLDLVQVTEDANAAKHTQVVRTLWSAAKTSFHVIVGGDTDISSLNDLEGKRVATGVTGSIESEMFLTALECAGVDASKVSIQNIGKTEAAEAYKDRSIDAWTGLGGNPTAAFLEVFESDRGARLIALDEDVQECVIDEYTYLAPSEIPAGTYPGQDEAVATVDQWFYAAVSADLPEDLVYALAKTLHENYDDMVAALPGAKDGTAENTAKIPGFPLHPGTLRLLEELNLDVAS